MDLIDIVSGALVILGLALVAAPAVFQMFTRAPAGERISPRNWRSASVTPVRTPRPNEPSNGRAYAGTSPAMVAMISSVIASSSGSITSATLGGSACQGPVRIEVVT
jgi:hypothetical protein